ncbi:MAG: hypothetical protein IPH35_02995 [Rhodoferax sp.]|nr:hypothetical protein [Rhodoferax sp.]
MEQQKKTIGRPKKPDSERLILRSIRMTPAQWEKIDAAGVEALRVLIDKWKPKTIQGTLRVPRS